MSLFGKLFGAKKPEPPAAPPPATAGEPIRVFDKFGREIQIPRDEWIKILGDNLKSSWDQPEALAGHIVQALQDGLFREVEEAARQLHRIDPSPDRGATLLAIVLLQTGRPGDAEKLLTRHLSRHGDDGTVLTNLAKAQSALGREAESRATLWHALKVDPNQDNALGWYEVIHREEEGDAGSLAALGRIAALPGSWRAQLWLARHQLDQRRLEAAIGHYREALDHAPRPVPADLLMQLSGDLGNHGHLPELLDLTEPHFDLATHGIQVGNNLIKALLDTGQLDGARDLLDQFQALQRPDWRDNLGFWEAELQKARLGTETPPTREQLQLSLLTLPGPLWLPADHPLAARFPRPADDAPHLVLSGSSFERPAMGDSVTLGPSDHPGRLSRALPLLLAEHLSLHSPARTTTLIPWVLNGGGGFAVSGKPHEDASLVEMAGNATRQASRPADYVLNSHLLVRGENLTLVLHLIRCIDGQLLAEHRHDFPEAAFHQVAARVLDELGQTLARETDIRPEPARPTLEGSELDHYLFRLEQALAVSCSTLGDGHAEFLSNPAEILDGLLHLCLQNPGHLPSRMLLLRSLRKLKKPQAALVESMRAKVEALMAEHPIDDAQRELEEDLRETMEA